MSYEESMRHLKAAQVKQDIANWTALKQLAKQGSGDSIPAETWRDFSPADATCAC